MDVVTAKLVAQEAHGGVFDNMPKRLEDMSLRELSDQVDKDNHVSERREQQAFDELVKQTTAKIISITQQSRVPAHKYVELPSRTSCTFCYYPEEHQVHQ